MEDSADVARMLLHEWLPSGTLEILERGQGPDTAAQLLVFLAAAHDLGKATPVFQYRPDVDESLRSRVAAVGFEKHGSDGDWKNAKHALISQVLLEKFGIDRSVAVILGGHHGKPPRQKTISDFKCGSRANFMGCDSAAWKAAQRELYDHALKISGISEATLKATALSIAQQMIYTGIVIMSDWIASGEEGVELPEPWRIAETDFSSTSYNFASRFGWSPNAVQSAMINALSDASKPGIAIIEAPMGSGKTEAALAGAEILARKTGRRGAYFGLPTQATADGMFSRFVNWISQTSAKEAHSFFLAHGKSAHNKKYTELRRYNVSADDESDVKPGIPSGSVYVNEWTTGRKKGLLSDFALGTIDQFLMCALRRKHLALRHLGFANKVAIIDEVHAYDAYMDSYLYMTLRWLGEYGVPVVVLSATLPPATRQKLIRNYLRDKSSEESEPDFTLRPETAPAVLPNLTKTEAYPLITYTDGDEVRQLHPEPDLSRAIQIDIEQSESTAAEICKRLDKLLIDGGCAGVIVNTVARAQKLAKELSVHFGSGYVRLLHAGFISIDRTTKEAELLSLLGPLDTAERPDKLIVVGTQVIEQSLDIDFDVLFTEICPVDLLIQRMGRLHRHKRPVRPTALSAPKCFVTGCDAFDDGSVAIYGMYTLMTTKYMLPGTICLPGDIAPLVEKAYGEGATAVPENEIGIYAGARSEEQDRIREKCAVAERFRLTDLTRCKPNLVGVLDYLAPEKSGEASVRDGEMSIEAILLQRIHGEYTLLPWVGDNKNIPLDSSPEPDTAFTLAGCKVRLPWIFSKRSETLEELQGMEYALRQACKGSPWLNEELFLALDENLEAELCGIAVKYDRTLGFIAEK
jgi:CRISPR-associated endonuclease/helicase Cas3